MIATLGDLDTPAARWANNHQFCEYDCLINLIPSFIVIVTSCSGSSQTSLTLNVKYSGKWVSVYNKLIKFEGFENDSNLCPSF